MNRFTKFLIGIFCLLSSCSQHKTASSDALTSIQLLDRNGFSETISLKDRLSIYNQTDFNAPQPYQKVVRVYGKASAGKTFSKITTYHPNGHLWQYLEIMSGRAHGAYREWHLNGQLKVSAQVIEGTPDVSEMAQMTWLFDGISQAFDEQGHLIAKIPYSKGLLEGTSLYYFSSGTLMKEIPYTKNEIDGIVHTFDLEGHSLEQIPYQKGEQDGLATAYWAPTKLKSKELYQNGLLIQAQYLNSDETVIAEIQNGFGKRAIFQENALASLCEYQHGKMEGEVQTFNATGCLTNRYFLKDEIKTGEEWEYYPTTDGIHHPKLYLEWDQDTIQGVAKTWYESGVLESQREMRNNKKHGLSFAWFKEGDLMLMEEYEDDILVKGSYFRKWEKTPTSKVENGKGVATLFDREGRFVRKIAYEKGLPQNEP